jgi:cardiolipin synthase (CMP-forming)
MAAAIITLVVIDLLPLWAALLVLARDAVVLVAAVWLALRGGPRIDVRPIGKYATFTLMWAIPAVAWGNAGFLLDDFITVLGWVWFVVGTVEYYAAAVSYAIDLRRALGTEPA